MPITESDRLARQNTFIEKAKSVHGDRFDYSKVYYTNNYTKVCILENEKKEKKSGRPRKLGKKELWQTPLNHLHFKGSRRDLERRFPHKMTAVNWEWHKKALKKAKNHRYYIHTFKESPKRRSVVKKRKFCRIHTYKCVFCGEKFKRKPHFHAYKGQYCSARCLLAHNKQKNLEKRLQYKYQIVLTEFRKKKELIEQFISKKDATKKYKELIVENSKIVLPQKYLMKRGKTIKLNNEIVLLERSEDNTLTICEKNELGKLINIKAETNRKQDKFIIINKQPYHSEQYFNIMNNDNQIDVNYILNDILLINSDDKTIMIYDKNLIIKKENDIELIVSEHYNIIIDLYNFLQKYCTKNKIKNIMFMGVIDGSPMLVDYYENKIREQYETK
jgi:hypothetical protein